MPVRAIDYFVVAAACSQCYSNHLIVLTIGSSLLNKWTTIVASHLHSCWCLHFRMLFLCTYVLCGLPESSVLFHVDISPFASVVFCESFKNYLIRKDDLKFSTHFSFHFSNVVFLLISFQSVFTFYISAFLNPFD